MIGRIGQSTFCFGPNQISDFCLFKQIKTTQKWVIQIKNKTNKTKQNKWKLGPASSVGRAFTYKSSDPSSIQHKAKITYWGEVPCARGNKLRNNPLVKILTQKIFDTETTKITGLKADFTQSWLNERERSSNKLALWRWVMSLRWMYLAKIWHGSIVKVRPPRGYEWRGVKDRKKMETNNSTWKQSQAEKGKTMYVEA